MKVLPMKTSSLLLTVAVLLQVTVRAQHLPPAEALLKTAADNCLSRVSKGKADEAFSVLLSEYWKDKNTTGQATVSMQRQYRDVLGRIQDTMGSPVPGGYEFIGYKRLGTSVLKLVYLQKNERFFLPWAFSFYRAADEWMLTYISFPDVSSDDLKDFVVIEPARSKP
jgi:hypothetical protein